MPIRLLCIPAAIAVVGFASCSAPRTYVNNAPFTPMFEGKGHVTSAMHLSFNHAEMQAGVAVTDHVGIVANVYGGMGATFWEAGAGYFLDLSDKARFEIYGGYGIGNIHIENWKKWYNEDIYDVSVNYSRRYIQPAIAVGDGRHTKVGLALRGSYIFYRKYEYMFRDSYRYGSYINWNIADSAVFSGFEGLMGDPMIFFRFGWQHLKFDLQIASSIVLFERRTRYQQHPVYRPAMINLGILIDIPPGS